MLNILELQFKVGICILYMLKFIRKQIQLEAKRKLIIYISIYIISHLIVKYDQLQWNQYQDTIQFRIELMNKKRHRSHNFLLTTSQFSINNKFSDTLTNATGTAHWSKHHPTSGSKSPYEVSRLRRWYGISSISFRSFYMLTRNDLRLYEKVSQEKNSRGSLSFEVTLIQRDVSTLDYYG